mgnify:CR=1 FL=1
MKFDKYIKIGVLGIALWSLTGCTDWLDVQPVDQVAEEQMFTSEEGFRQGLNGVYVELCSSNLYGGDLQVGTVEVLAQRYKFANYWDNLITRPITRNLISPVFGKKDML